jgi:hypothetical protein
LIVHPLGQQKWRKSFRIGFGLEMPQNVMGVFALRRKTRKILRPSRLKRCSTLKPSKSFPALGSFRERMRLCELLHFVIEGINSNEGFRRADKFIAEQISVPRAMLMKVSRRKEDGNIVVAIFKNKYSLINLLC